MAALKAPFEGANGRMEKTAEILNFVPSGPDWHIPWTKIEDSALRTWIGELRNTMQNPRWHGEGDVWTHTRMVCEELAALEGFRNLEERKRREVFLAALLHDFGKAPCTRLEEGNWTSPNHGAAGARIARELLWTEYGLAGTPDTMEFRETVCSLIRYHTVPPHLLERAHPEQLLIRIASGASLMPDFSLELLLLLAEADMRGRIADEMEDAVERVRLCGIAAEEYGCLSGPVLFPDEFSEYAYLSRAHTLPGQALYDDTWGEVILLCGLPGTGKDTWIREHCPQLQMVSLDEIRKRMRPSKAKDGSLVAAAAREQARDYLRRRMPFVWNATCLTPEIRSRQIRLFESYGARVRVVYLETDWETRGERNLGRGDAEAVLETAVRGMLEKLVPPERFEAQRVRWKCV